MQRACSLIDGVLRACAGKLFMTWKFGIISCHSSAEQMNCSVHHAGDSPFLTLGYDPALRCAFVLTIFLLCFRNSLFLLPPQKMSLNLSRGPWHRCSGPSVPSPACRFSLFPPSSAFRSRCSSRFPLSYDHVGFEYSVVVAPFPLTRSFPCRWAHAKPRKSPVGVDKSRFLIAEG